MSVESQIPQVVTGRSPPSNVFGVSGGKIGHKKSHNHTASKREVYSIPMFFLIPFFLAGPPVKWVLTNLVVLPLKFQMNFEFKTFLFENVDVLT